MKKKLVIIFGIILAVSAVLFLTIKPTTEFNEQEFEQNIKEITSNTKIIDANENHNQAIDVAEYAYSKNIYPGKILINFDTHSDAFINWNVLNHETEISNWINEYFAKFPEVEELYWVMPKEEALNLNLRLLFADNDYKNLENNPVLYGNSLKKLNLLKFIFTPLTKQAYTQEFLIDPDTGMMNELVSNEDYKKLKIPFDTSNTKLKKIKIITCTEETLPDFDGKEVFLSIDADYISNSGFDTAANFINKKNKKEAKLALFNMIKTIKDKNIRPQVINLTLSPQYLPEELHQTVIDFFDKIFEVSKKSDALNSYKRQIDPYRVKEYERFLKNQILYFLE